MSKRKNPQKILDRKMARDKKNKESKIIDNSSTQAVRRRRRSPSERDKSRLMLMVLILFLVLGIIWSLFFILNKNNENLPENLSSADQKSSDDKALIHGKTGKTPDEDRRNAQAAAAKIVGLASVNPKKNQTQAQRAESLGNRDISVVTKEFVNNLYFPKETDDDTKYNSIQALVALNDLLVDPKVKLNPPIKDKESYKGVFLDGERGEAFVPVMGFTKDPALFSIEMVWVDNKWKIAPYSLVSEIKLSTFIQEKMERSKLESSSTPTSGPTIPPTTTKK